MLLTLRSRPWIRKVAQAGLIAKGVVYVLLGALGFMAAFELGGKQNGDASQKGAMQTLKELPAGTILLLLLAAGLVCYSIWRGIQAFYKTDNKEKPWYKRLRYLFSGLAYVSLAYTATKALFGKSASGGDKNQMLASQLMDKPFGQVLVGLAALVLAGIGGYQVWYGLSEKYKKHVQELSLQSAHANSLLRAGKIGYISRGLVWLIIAFLFGKAAVHATASQAGNTGKAFRFLEDSPFGSYLLGLLSLGLIAYGIFNFVRARYEHLA
jgi:hypothetical protein